MNSVAAALGFVLLGYLLGSTPSAYLLAVLFGRGDIRAVGSGNVGGMNVLRNVHPLAGLLTGALDVLKGAAAAWIAGTWGAALGAPSWVPLAAAVAAVTGHNYMLFLRFRGGKGLGATAGALLVLWPAGILWLLGVIGVGAVVLRDTNTGTGVGVWLLPVVFWFSTGSSDWTIFAVALALVISSKHLTDIQAYLRGRRQLV